MTTSISQQESFFLVWKPRLLSVLRIVVAALFMEHGTAKLFHVPHVAAFDNLQLMSLVGLGGVLELVGGLVLLVGLFTRPVAFVLSGEMAFAYFMAHAARDPLPILNGGELAVVYCFLFLFLAAAGGGSWSVDAKLRRYGLHRRELQKIPGSSAREYGSGLQAEFRPGLTLDVGQADRWKVESDQPS